jgi:ribosomal protein S17E
VKRDKLFLSRILYIDAHLSPDYCTVMDAVFGMTVKEINKEFGQRAKDIDWIYGIRDRYEHAVIFGTDFDMSRKALEKQALASTKMPFILAVERFQNLRFHDQIWRVIRDWPTVMQMIDKTPGILEVDFEHNKYRLKYRYV